MRRTVINCLENFPASKHSRNLVTELLASAGSHSSPEGILGCAHLSWSSKLSMFTPHIHRTYGPPYLMCPNDAAREQRGNNQDDEIPKYTLVKPENVSARGTPEEAEQPHSCRRMGGLWHAVKLFHETSTFLLITWLSFQILTTPNRRCNGKDSNFSQ